MFVDQSTKQSNKIKKEEQEVVQDDVVYFSVDLPSKGRLGYSESIEYRDILVRDEKELASATEKTFVKVLNSVIKGLLKDKSKFEELTIYDRDFLLLWIWANSYSTIKSIEVQCPHCGHKNQHDIDLTKLEVKDLSEEYTHPHEIVFSDGEKIKVRLVTVGDEELVRKFCASNQEVEETFALFCNSVSFDVVMSLKDKIKKMSNIKGKDMAKIRGFHQKFKYGVNDRTSAPCSSCGEVSEFTIPFQVDFFLPTL